MANLLTSTTARRSCRWCAMAASSRGDSAVGRSYDAYSLESVATRAKLAVRLQRSRLVVTHTFPADFLWGAATSAYQIEGSPLADGAGESIWHRFAHTPGKIADGSHGDVACDHYRRFADDVRLMRELGLGAYRFSTSWSRVLPEGVGRVNQAGLDFYSRLVDTLLEHDIQPMVTLYHWDLPAALEDRGGWADPRSADWFAEYAQLMYRTLGDRVPMWATINEPWVIVDQGYVEGQHAPGRRDWAEAAARVQELAAGPRGRRRGVPRGGQACRSAWW